MKKCWILLLLLVVPLIINSVNAHEETARLDLLKQEELETNNAIITAKIPHVINVKDESIKVVINNLINQTIDDYLDELQQGEPNQEHKVIADLSYQNYYSDDLIISFSLNFTQILADSYVQKKFFTIDLTNGEIYSVEHFLGPDYQSLIKNEVLKQVSANLIKYPNLS